MVQRLLQGIIIRLLTLGRPLIADAQSMISSATDYAEMSSASMINRNAMAFLLIY
jgi:hypothetical protein